MDDDRELYNDFKDLIEDVEYLFETGLNDPPTPVPSVCRCHFKFFKAMVEATYNKAKRLRAKWVPT